MLRKRIYSSAWNGVITKVVDLIIERRDTSNRKMDDDCPEELSFHNCDCMVQVEKTGKYIKLGNWPDGDDCVVVGECKAEDNLTVLKEAIDKCLQLRKQNEK